MNILSVNAQEKHIDISIYGNIGKSFWETEQKVENNCLCVEDLEKILQNNKNANTIDIYINSTGGSVFEGIAIYNILKRHKAYKKVHINGFACSIASVIAMCGNQVLMPKSSIMMIHNAWTVAMGNSKEMRKIADDLDKINEMIKSTYINKTNIDMTTLTELMDNESYLSADECLQYGFCTKVEDDTEETQNSVDNALNENISLFSNKLDRLKEIKNTIKALEDVKDIEVEEVEDSKEAEQVELSNEAETTDENIETPNNEEIAKAENRDNKENAIKHFFNF